VFPPRYFVHMEEVHGNGNSFFSPYIPELAQFVPGFFTPRSIHGIRSKRHLRTLLRDFLPLGMGGYSKPGTFANGVLIAFRNEYGSDGCCPS
jgi:hypothetical protein